jgi:hypothetical protein
MKKLKLVLVVMIAISSYAEAPNVGETLITVKNNYSHKTIQLRVTLISDECWLAVSGGWGLGYEDHHPITDLYNHTNELSYQTTTQTQDIIGIDMCYDDIGNTPVLGLGRYKIEILEDGSPTCSMNVDYRTSAYPEENADICFVYYADSNTLYISDESRLAGDNEKCWVLSGGEISYETDFLQPYPPDNFMITNRNQWDSNPQLSWSHSSEDDYWTGYNVYRRVAAGSYQKIAELSTYTTSYTDQYTIISEAGSNISYYVKAVNGSKLSDPTQSISVVGNTTYKNGHEANSLTFYLNQNYPNPFNPTTSISYSIPTDEFVNLKVYDITGKEITILENERKTAGIHQLNFNAENLSSGIYIYTISAGKYSSSKKLLLVK